MAAHEQVVTDPAAVRALVEPVTRTHLAPFLGRELETAQAAREVGTTTEAMAYRVGRLVRLGLLAPVSSRARAGRRVVRYRAAEVIRGPLEMLPETEVTALFDVIDAEGRTAFLRGLAAAATRRGMVRWDLLLDRGPRGDVRVGVSPSGTSWQPGDPAPGAPPVVFNWVPLTLDDAGARELQARLLEVVETLPAAAGRPTHLCGLFLGPVEA